MYRLIVLSLNYKDICFVALPLIKPFIYISFINLVK
jgi:hypothetical protein